jgi:hypothetical protein
MHTYLTLPRFALRAVAGAAMLATLPAMANLATPISVSLIAPGGYTSGTGGGDPTPLTLTQSVVNGPGITLAGGGDIGGWMLPNEQVALSGDSIHISSYRGDDTVARTGWLGIGADHARYELSGLSIANATITGFTVSDFDGFGSSGFQGDVAGTSFVDLIDSDTNGSLDTLIFNLDDLRFKDRGAAVGSSLDHADFNITILSTPNGTPPPPPPPPPPPNPTPEPGTLLLSLAAIAGSGLATRRCTQVTRPAPPPADGH